MPIQSSYGQGLKPAALSPHSSIPEGPFSAAKSLSPYASMGERDIKFLHKDRFNSPSIQETRRPLQYRPRIGPLLASGLRERSKERLGMEGASGGCSLEDITHFLLNREQRPNEEHLPLLLLGWRPIPAPPARIWSPVTSLKNKK